MDYPGGPQRATVIELDNSNTGSATFNEVGFYDSGTYDATQSRSEQSGYDYGKPSSALPSGNMDSMSYRSTDGGVTRKLLENKGFGWLLEVNDEDNNQTSLLEELDIDLTDIYYKIRCVLLPLPYFRMKLNIVRESPDFWGPLIVVIAYALLSIYGQFSVVSWILTMWFCGGFMVYFIARALGGDVGYYQVLGVVGYCLIPLVCTGLLTSMLSSFRGLSFVLSFMGVAWSVYSAGTLLCVDELQARKPLVLYPVFLLYVYFFSLYSGV